MPRDPERRRAQQRELMAKRRAASKTETGQTHTDSEGTSGGVFRPFRDEAGRMVLKPGGKDLGGEHYWGWISHAEEGTRICEAFEFGAGHWIGGCGMVVKWEGKALSTRLDGADDLGKVIMDSPHGKRIQSAMPVTKGREPR